METTLCCWRLSRAYCTLRVEVSHDASCTGCIPMGRPKHLARRAGSLCLLYLPWASLQHPIPTSVMVEGWLLQPQTSHIHCHPIQPELGLPTFRGCVSSQSTHWPAFMRALSSALRCVILENTEEAWLKLFTLSKCVLPSLQHKGCRGKPLATSGHSVVGK